MTTAPRGPSRNALISPATLRRYLPEKVDRVFSTWDLSFKDVESARGEPDFVAGHAWALSGSSLLLLPWEYHEQAGFPEAIRGILSLCSWCEDMGLPLAGVHVEDKANGPAVIRTLRASVPGVLAWPGEDPDERRLAASSKESRAHAAAVFVRSGNVVAPSPEIAPWVGAWLAEIEAYPLGTFDDRVDTLSMACAVAFLDASRTRRDGYWDALQRLGAGRGI